jgi:hypothetical protein
MAAYAPRRRRHSYGGRRAHALSNPMRGGELALAFISGGLGFALADFADRYLATYDPSAVAAGTTTAPTDRFTGGTNGTLANTLNIASPPSLLRIGVGVGITAVPALGQYLVKNSMGKAALQGMMLGAGIKLFSMLWNAYVMGNLLKPASTAQADMQKSLGARLYPAETVASQNLAASPVPYTAPTGLNAPPRNGGLPARQQRPQAQRPQGMGDPGPFAVAQQAAAQAAAPAGVSEPPADQPCTEGPCLGDQMPGYLGFVE